MNHTFHHQKTREIKCGINQFHEIWWFTWAKLKGLSEFVKFTALLGFLITAGRRRGEGKNRADVGVHSTSKHPLSILERRCMGQHRSLPSANHRILFLVRARAVAGRHCQSWHDKPKEQSLSLKQLIVDKSMSAGTQATYGLLSSRVPVKNVNKKIISKQIINSNGIHQNSEISYLRDIYKWQNAKLSHKQHLRHTRQILCKDRYNYL